MSLLVGVVDERHERGAACLRAATLRLEGFPTLTRGERRLGGCAIAWAAVPSAPISDATFQGRRGFVMGHSCAENSEGGADSRSGAERLLDESIRIGHAALSSRGGYHLAILSEPHGSIAIGVDPLGFFPLYYYAKNGLTVFATAPGFCLEHPDFVREPSPHGLVGVLLTRHITCGQTIWKGLRRLQPGHVLHCDPGAEPRETKVVSFPSPDPSIARATETKQFEVLDDILGRIVRREAERGSTAILLSGGLDSRVIAGYLHEAGNAVSAVTFGDDGDHEMACASRVARSLGWRHLRVPVEYDRFLESARALVALEHLSGGLNDVVFFQSAPAIAAVAPNVMTGVLGDFMLGGTHISHDAGRPRELSFETHFKRINRWGLAPEILRRLIRPEFLGSAMEDVQGAMRTAYEAIECLPFQRAWFFDTANWGRLHTATAVTWRTSFGAWPTTPFIDMGLLRVIFGIPAVNLAGRRTEIALLRRRFPALAALPIDRNSRRLAFLVPTLESTAYRYLHRWRRWIGQRRDRRFYYRTLDFDNRGWRTIRRAAESDRHRLDAICDPSVLREIVPGPDTKVRVDDGIMDVSAKKNLLGLMLWAGKYLG